MFQLTVYAVYAILARHWNPALQARQDGASGLWDAQLYTGTYMLLLAFGLVQPPPRAAALHLQARILRAALVGCTRNEMHGAGCTRRGLLGACLGMMPAAALARTPGSEDVGEAVQQIEDAAAALKKLRSEWSSVAVIDAVPPPPLHRTPPQTCPGYGQTIFDRRVDMDQKDAKT